MGWPYQVDAAAIKEELWHYLQAHPNSQDTFEGVVEWWLVRSRVRNGVQWVREGLEQLEAEGRVVREVTPDHVEMFKAAGSEQES